MCIKCTCLILNVTSEPIFLKFCIFFQTGISPISREETIEIFTFMKASNMSKEENGRIVTLEEAYQKGWKDARKLIKTYNK